MMFVLDDSSSLLPWWPQLTEGFRAFIQENDSRGLHIGAMMADEICEPSGYFPPLVPIEALPANLAALEDATPEASIKSTSTVPVFTAALQHARGWMADHPGQEVVVVMMTDASPGACDGLTGDFEGEVSRLASEAHAASPPIDTYVVGGGGLSFIDMIASAGGTTAYPIVTLAPPEDVLRALREIRGNPEPCTFTWPSGATLTADTRVVVSSASSARSYPIAGAACAQDGFYLERQQLIACPSTCAALIASDQLSLSDTCK